MDILKSLDLAGCKVVEKVMEGYKKTEVGIIPNEWRVDKIGDITEIKTGGTPSKDNEEYWSNGNIPWMVSGDINKKIVREVNGKITNLGMEKSAAKLLPPKTVMIALNGQGKTKGTVAYLETEVTCNQSLAGFIPNDKYNSKYLYYNLQSRYLEIRNLVGDEARNGLSLGLLRDIYVPLPSYEEQQKIAEILSTVDSQIDYTDKLIEKTKELKKGLMQRLLTKGIGHKEFKMTEIGEIPMEWEIREISDITSFIGSGVTPKGGEKVYVNEGVSFIRSQNVLVNKLSTEDIAHISEEVNNKMKRTEVFEGDLLLNITGASIGRCALVPGEFGKGNVNQHVCILRLNQGCDKYLIQVMNSSYIKNQIDSFNGGSSREGLNFQQVKKLQVQYPPVKEQEQIAKILSSVDIEIEGYENKKNKLEKLKEGLMQQLLIGKIKVF